MHLRLYNKDVSEEIKSFTLFCGYQVPLMSVEGNTYYPSSIGNTEKFYKTQYTLLITIQKNLYVYNRQPIIHCFERNFIFFIDCIGREVILHHYDECKEAFEKDGYFEIRKPEESNYRGLIGCITYKGMWELNKRLTVKRDRDEMRARLNAPGSKIL